MKFYVYIKKTQERRRRKHLQQWVAEGLGICLYIKHLVAAAGAGISISIGIALLA